HPYTWFMYRKSAITLTMLFITWPLFAAVGGRITGTVKDPTGASLSGASVVAINSATGVKQVMKTDDQGVYSFPTLVVGQYNIEASASGFTPHRRTGLVI